MGRVRADPVDIDHALGVVGIKGTRTKLPRLLVGQTFRPGLIKSGFLYLDLRLVLVLDLVADPETHRDHRLMHRYDFRALGPR